MANIEALRRAAIFEDISATAIEQLCSRGQIVSYRPGQNLFERGQPATELLILQRGSVELYYPVHVLGAKRELTLENKQVGDVVAWSALVSPYQFTLGARCASDCELTSFSRNVLQDFFDSDPQTGCLFMRNLAGVIGRRLQNMQSIWLHDLESSAIKSLEK